MTTNNIERHVLHVCLNVCALLLAGLGMIAARLLGAYVVLRRWDRELTR